MIKENFYIIQLNKILVGLNKTFEKDCENNKNKKIKIKNRVLENKYNK